MYHRPPWCSPTSTNIADLITMLCQAFTGIVLCHMSGVHIQKRAKIWEVVMSVGISYKFLLLFKLDKRTSMSLVFHNVNVSHSGIIINPFHVKARWDYFG